MTDMEQYLKPKCRKCGMDLVEIPEVFAKEQYGHLFFCEKETCTEFEKKVLV